MGRQMGNEAKNIRSSEASQLFRPVEWSRADEAGLLRSESRIRQGLEEESVDLFCRGLEEAQQVYSGYNAHTRELAQVLSSLEYAVREKPEAFLALAASAPEMMENLLGDLETWRKFMGSNPYAMEDIHKLHEPTMSAVYSVISQIHPEFTTLPEDEDEMEFF